MRVAFTISICNLCSTVSAGPAKHWELYKNIIHPKCPNCGFIGLVASYNWAQTSDLQARWFIDFISDPIKYKSAKLIKQISYNEVINKNLKVMDLTAISLAKDTKIPIFVTNIFKKNSLINVLNQKGSYSKIS